MIAGGLSTERRSLTNEVATRRAVPALMKRALLPKSDNLARYNRVEVGTSVNRLATSQLLRRGSERRSPRRRQTPGLREPFFGGLLESYELSDVSPAENTRSEGCSSRRSLLCGMSQLAD